MLTTSLIKYGFRIRTRHGLVVENLAIQARDEADAERKLRQMYRHCEVLDCTLLGPVGTAFATSVAMTLRRADQMSFEDVVSLLSK